MENIEKVGKLFRPFSSFSFFFLSWHMLLHVWEACMLRVWVNWAAGLSLYLIVVVEAEVPWLAHMLSSSQITQTRLPSFFLFPLPRLAPHFCPSVTSTYSSQYLGRLPFCTILAITCLINDWLHNI
jgi:hypothetical protein